MPGIYGIVRKSGANREANAQLLARMRSCLGHYDNYVSEQHIDDWFALGSTSLPFPGESRLVYDPEKKCAAAFSGYIYGFRDRALEPNGPATQKPARLLDLYHSKGRDFPTMMDGSFNAAVFDSTARRALVGNDRMGYRQFYYLDTPDLFIFAPEIKAILACSVVKPCLSRTGVTEYFNFAYPLGDNTMFEGVRSLRGGHVIEINQGNARFNCYWDFHYTEETRASLPELIDEADTMYRGVIRRRLEGYQRALVPLSGGLDSRFLVAHAALAGAEVNAFTHGRRGCLDHVIASQVAQALHVPNYRFIEIDSNWLVDHFEAFVALTEGMVDASPSILLGISDQYDLPVDSTCFLNGLHGGPVNLGTGYFRPDQIGKNVSHDEKIRLLSRAYGVDTTMHRFYPLFAEEFAQELRAAYFDSLNRELSTHLHVSDWFYNQRDVFFIRNRSTRYLNLVDCNRFRWHDHFAPGSDQLVDFYIKLPAAMKPGRRFFIEYLKAKFPVLAKIAYQATGVNLYTEPPRDLLGLRGKRDRVKYYLERISCGQLRFYDHRRYTHQNQWYRDNPRIRNFYEQTLLDERTLERGYFNPDAVQKHLSRQRFGGDSFYELTSLVTFEMFLRRFIDGA